MKQNAVDEYISTFPKEIQTRLQQIRKTIKSAAPGAEEGVSYGIAGYKLQGALVYFAGFKNHIGFYPVPSGMKAFEKELATYKASKATAQFPHDKPIPFDLISKIVRFRVEENLGKAKAKKVARKKQAIETNPFSTLSVPAQRALANNGVTTLKQLSKHSEKDVLKFHGMGPASIPKLKAALRSEALSFRNTK